jgi:hypothetical protein
MSGIAGAASDARPTLKISFVTPAPQPTWHKSVNYIDFVVEGLTTLPEAHQIASSPVACPGRDGKDTFFSFNFSRTTGNPEKIGVFFRVSNFYAFVSITVRLFIQNLISLSV